MVSVTLPRIVVTLLFCAGIGAVVFFDAHADTPGGAVQADFQLSESTGSAGVDFTHRDPELDPRIAHIEPYVATVGASASVGDANGDGRPDLYLTTSAFGASNALYLNEGGWSFRDVAAEAGVGALNDRDAGASMGSVWADYDNDGDQDLLVFRWGRPALLENLSGSATSDAVGPDGSSDPDELRVPRFRDVTERAGLDVWMNANCAVWLDYDRDGLLDLYLCGYYRNDLVLWDLATTLIMPDSWEFSSNGGRNRLFHNEGDGRFEEVTEHAGVGTTRWTLAASSADFDGDGWPDLYLANDYGPEELYLNRPAPDSSEHDRRFELADVGLEESGSGMSVALGDLRNSGSLDVYVTNISQRGFLFQGNNLRLNFLDELGRFEEAATASVADAGWAWGAQFGDLNLDGLTDLVVVNGMISASQENDYWYDMAKITGANRAVFEDAANWPAIGDRSLSGYERSRVYLNRPRRGLVDVAGLVGVRDRLDGRGVALADFDGDGDPDLAIANQRGPALLYRNSTPPTRHWLGLRLVGTRSNRGAVGAEVVLHFGGTRQRQVLAAPTGYAAQNDSRLLFGLGSVDHADSVEIAWPSGLQQVVRNLDADRYHEIREPRDGASGDRSDP